MTAFTFTGGVYQILTVPSSTGGAFSTVDVAGASGTQLTRIKNVGPVTGYYIDAINEFHGLTGQ